MRHLTPKEETRIRRAMEDRIAFFSPTISPAPKNPERNEIESIYEALKYYREYGFDQAILQPKFMGSYCDIYLHREIEKTRFFSRNGYPIAPRLIKHEELIEAVKPLHQRMSAWFNRPNPAQMLIIQSELMPWSALGQGLITRDFKGYGLCHQSHADYLSSSGIKQAIGSILNSDDFKQYLRDVATLDVKQIADKYPQHVLKQYEAMRFLNLPNPDRYQEALGLYHSQVEIYGGTGELRFKPFNLLKTIWEDGNETFEESNIAGYNFVADDPDLRCVIHFGDHSEDSDYSEAYHFFDQLVSQNMEGVVIKPKQIWDRERVPMFKVRNNNYLQMIYGVNFQEHYDYYLERRRVGKKMKCSINEWNIAQTLLRIPNSEISSENHSYHKLVSMRILEEDFEGTLDRRL